VSLLRIALPGHYCDQIYDSCGCFCTKSRLPEGRSPLVLQFIRKLLCPHLVLVEARPKLYVEYHHSIIEAVEKCVPISHVMSIDEMACRLMGRERFLPNVTTIGYSVKEALRSIGITLRCSVGLAPNRYLSKIAADICKPDGLVRLEEAPMTKRGISETRSGGVRSSDAGPIAPSVSFFQLTECSVVPATRIILLGQSY